MARLRCTARKSVIPFLPSHLAERPLRRTVSGQSSQLERLHRRLHEEQERRCQEQEQDQEQQDSSPSSQQEVESERPPSPAPQPGMPPAPTQGIPATGGDPDRDGDDDNVGGSSSHNTELSEEPEPEGWIARPITRDAARGCHFHDALDTLLRRAFDRHTWSIEYRCVVYQHRCGLYLDQWEATFLVRRPDNDLRGAEAFSEHYSITERDTAEAAMQDAARRALSQYCSLFSGVADGLDLKYYPRRSTDSAGGVIVSPVGEGNPRLNNMVNLAAVLNTELDHALDELGKVRAEVVELLAECASCHYLDGGSPAPVGIQHPYRSPPRGRFDYGTPDCRTRIDLDP
jgi:hypothetical protein